jgi:hypothetical protein
VHTWTIRAAALGVLSAASLIGASVGSPAGAAPVATAGSGFSGPLAAHVVARPIERDLTPSTRISLHSVPCAVPSASRSCFAAGR